MRCRFCGDELKRSLVDLGSAPPSNAYLTAESLSAAEQWFPLRVLVCEQCWLVQTEDFVQAQQLFHAEYAYFSSFSRSWLAHAERYVRQVIDRFALHTASQVVEVAANDGYLLQYVQAQGIPCLGIESTAGTAAAARRKGLDIIEAFFGLSLAQQLVTQGHQADLIVANNVLAHVPELNDFVGGLAHLLKPQGVLTLEFTHLQQLIEHTLFDTIYHEHYSYLSLTVVTQILQQHGLQIFDVEQLPTQGGSLRVFAQRQTTGRQPIETSVADLLQQENLVGMTTAAYYARFQDKVDQIKNDFLAFLLDCKRLGKKVAAYGAAAKGNTLLNYAGIRPDLLPFVVDRNPDKQGKYLPGSRIPIVAEDVLRRQHVDYVIILPWNIKVEVMQQLDYISAWHGKFVTAIPSLHIDG